MTDITIGWNNSTGTADWLMNGPDLQSGNDLATAIIVSLFTDRLASSDYVPPPPASPKDRRGWWADTYNSSLIGSRLWQLYRGVKTNSQTILLQAADYAAEALQWLIDDGVVGSFSIYAQWQNANFLAISVTANMPNSTSQTFRFAWAWNNITALPVPSF